MPCNILHCVDDIVLVSPSWYAQQQLLCSAAISLLVMSFNISKSVTVHFFRHINQLVVFRKFFLVFWCWTAVICRFRIHVNIETFAFWYCWYCTLETFIICKNYLTRKVSKGSIQVKISVFKTYCINFYGIALWNHFNISILKNFESAYD